jgi:hypothetical protein
MWQRLVVGDCLILDDVPSRLSQNLCNYQPVLRNIPEYQRQQLQYYCILQCNFVLQLHTVESKRNVSHYVYGNVFSIGYCFEVNTLSIYGLVFSLH